jgi:2-polyprenyl-3-methyl-5-hydroxy-6-metoxy-1,4-benzoquinol methylase
MDTKDLLSEQIAYYRARANEYDEWFLRQGRYDRGPELNARWQSEVTEVRVALDAFNLTGDILELACGTGLWTEQLTQTASSITAIDSSPEMIELNRQRLIGKKNIRYVQTNIFDWKPDRQYDNIFFSFWLSHVPHEQFDAFWNSVRQALRPGGSIFVIDSLYDEQSTARNHHLPDKEATILERRLNSGEIYHVVKVFYTPDELTQRLALLGLQADLTQTSRFFLYGIVY